MNLKQRILFAASLSALANSTFWLESQHINAGNEPRGLAFLLVGAGALFRMLFEISLIVFVLLPMSLTLAPRLRAHVLILSNCFAAGCCGAIVALLMRYSGHWPEADILWHSLSFILSGMIWSVTALVMPINEVAFGWRAATNAGIDALISITRSLDRAAPWLALGYLLPFLILAAWFLGYTLLS